MSNKKKTALYIRVSTDAQVEGYSIDAQKERLEGYCKSQGIKDYEFYIDGGWSGSNIVRPSMQKLVDETKAGMIDRVVVYKLDRFSRSQKDTLYLIEDVFNPHNTDFVSLNENMDTSTPMGRAMLGVLSAFAQLERETIRERTRMGMKERVKSGLWMGGGRVPFGYDYDRNKGILVPNKDAETVRKIYDLYLKGYSTEKIAQILGLKYDRLAMQILTRKTNVGYIVYNDEEYIGQHEPIISMETYNKTMDMIKDRSVRRNYETNFLLTGLVYCGKCGAKMRYQKWGKYGYKLVCYSQQKSKQYLIKDPNCDNEKVWADEIEDQIVKDLMQLHLEKGESKNENKSYSVLALLHQQYDIISNKIKKLYNLYAESNDDLLLETINDNKADLEKISHNIKVEVEREAITNKIVSAKITLENLSDAWEYMTAKEKQSAVRELVEKVELDGNKIIIRYTLDGI